MSEIEEKAVALSDAVAPVNHRIDKLNSEIEQREAKIKNLNEEIVRISALNAATKEEVLNLINIRTGIEDASK